MCDAAHASHQPDVLYLHALHFARVSLKNVTRLGEGRGDEEVTPEQHVTVNTFSIPITEKNMHCVFWEVSCFPHPSFFFLVPIV